MKSLTKWTLTAAALLMLAAAVPAHAYEWGRRGDGYRCGWRHRDIVWDRHNLHRQWRDIGRDRFALRRDIANGDWAAAQAQRGDIREDLMNVRRQRRDLYRDYHGIPDPPVHYLPFSNYGALPPAPYGPQPPLPPLSRAYLPASYAPAQYDPAAPNYAGQGLGALLGNFLLP
jgi:hypothetical protein